MAAVLVLTPGKLFKVNGDILGLLIPEFAERDFGAPSGHVKRLKGDFRRRRLVDANECARRQINRNTRSTGDRQNENLEYVSWPGLSAGHRCHPHESQSWRIDLKERGMVAPW